MSKPRLSQLQKKKARLVALVIVVIGALPFTGAAQLSLAGKTWVIEGPFRGRLALQRDTLELVQRAVPRNNDFIEFFSDSTFHLNFFSRTRSSISGPYRKSFWEPGIWRINAARDLFLRFDDDGLELHYAILREETNRVIWLKQSPRNTANPKH